jgi:hypothetical protein
MPVMAHVKTRWTAGFGIAAAAAGAGAWLLDAQPRSTLPAWTWIVPAVAAGAAGAGAGDLFTPIADVLRHPRCMNCHPRDDRPRQGNDAHIHQQNVVRGDDNLGFVNMRCTSCHGEENNQASGVPGAPTWHLAPLSMGWQGLTNPQLCAVLKDEKLNGGKTVAALVEHMTNDKLVLWGWTPGGKRDPVSTPHATFVTHLTRWASASAPCPG